MANISIIGNGNMGQALSSVFGKGDHNVQVIAGSGDNSPVTGDIVVLAVPYAALSDIAAKRGSELAGKVVVDITNPINFETFQLNVPADSSAAAELAQALPQSKVVKAFNTNFGPTLASGSIGDQTTTVLIAGDDAEAKSALASAVESGGLKAIDAGPLGTARNLEALAHLQIGLAAQEKVGWTGGFAVVA